MQSILEALQHREPSILQFSFNDPFANIALQLGDGQITSVRSAVLPPWSVSLIQHKVHPAAVASASQSSSTSGETLRLLIEQGHLTAEEVADIGRSRVVSALLPIVFREGAAIQTQLSGKLPPRALGSTDAAEAVQVAQAYAGRLGEEARSLQPADVFLRVAPAELAWPEHDRSVQEQSVQEQSVHEQPVQERQMVWQLAGQGLTLAEIARRLPMRWDRLAEHVAALLKQGALRRASGQEPTAAAAKLRAGQPAPDFRLPGLAGENLRLSELRGQRVWLVFNRQSTCALCNPHHAQIITLHERLRQQGVQIVSIWGSSVEALDQGIGTLSPPYPVLADPQDRVYNQYGLEMSLRGTLDARNLPTLMKGLKMVGASALKSDGELLRMPAEFLIGPDGTIEVAHYNSYGSDWLPVEQVLEWAAAPADSGATGS